MRIVSRNAARLQVPSASIAYVSAKIVSAREEFVRQLKRPPQHLICLIKVSSAPQSNPSWENRQFIVRI